MLSDADLLSMRATMNESLPGTAVVSGGSLTPDGGGGWTETFTARGTVACRVAVADGSERQAGKRLSSEAQYILTLPAETPVETDDRIVIDGVVYNVAAVRDRSWEISRRVEATKVV